MSSERFDINSCEPYANGKEVGDAGAFELIHLTACCVVDPDGEDESRIRRYVRNAQDS